MPEINSTRSDFKHVRWWLPTLQEENTEAGRYYSTGTTRYESVTNFIGRLWDKSFLDDWKAREGEANAAHKQRVASQRGHSLHGGIEHYLTNKGMPDYEDNPHNRMLFLKIKPHLNKIDNIRIIEQPICSIKLGLAGRPDCISDYDHVESVIDFKTSTKLKQKSYIITYFLQCGFYGYMVRELYGEPAMPEQAVIIMATEDNPRAQVFKEKMSVCVGMVEQFVKDPMKFQAKWDAMKKSKTHKYH